MIYQQNKKILNQYLCHLFYWFTRFTQLPFNTFILLSIYPSINLSNNPSILSSFYTYILILLYSSILLPLYPFFLLSFQPPFLSSYPLIPFNPFKELRALFILVLVLSKYISEFPIPSYSSV